MAIGAFTAGLLGALTGLGGGVVIVPLLTLGFGVDIRYAVGASLVSVIATSSGAAAAYVREGFTNIRIGMFLEIATTIGAVAGALSGGADLAVGAGGRLRPGPAVLGVVLQPASRGVRRGSAGSAGRPAAARRQLSQPDRGAASTTSARARWASA